MQRLTLWTWINLAYTLLKMLLSPPSNASKSLQRMIARGDLPAVHHLLSGPDQIRQGLSAKKLVNSAVGWHGTALTQAAANPVCTVELLDLLLAHGANLSARATTAGVPGSALAAALGSGDLRKAQFLVHAGADLHYAREGYTALIDALHGRDILADPGLLPLLTWLIEQDVALNSITPYLESALRVLSHIGRFDAVKLLLAAGADAEQLGFSQLHTAIALGELSDLQAALPASADLERTDWWSRTPLLLAVQCGELQKVQCLLDHGAKLQALGRCGKPALFYPIEMQRADVLRWLIGTGVDLEQTDEFGCTTLMTAAQTGFTQGIDILLAAGAAVDREHNGQTALSLVCCRDAAQRLMAAGADPSFLAQDGVRLLLGFKADPDESELDCTPEQFEAARVRQFATHNGQDITTPYYLAMIRSGVNSYAALQALARDPSQCARFGEDAIPPIWCAQRFGQSLTFLPDGRIIQIGGEHEDSYDPDFCIYNDVFVHGTERGITVYGYPQDVFPPTDFHSATLTQDAIYIIGNLGYSEARTPGTTPVLRLNTADMTITRLVTSGCAPSWLHRHRAVLVSADEIEVSGGTVVNREGNGLDYAENRQVYALNLTSLVWTER